jgi:hypothetical protein
MLLLASMSLWMEWAGFLFFGPRTWLVAESHFFLYFYYRGPLGLMGFGPLANFWGFRFGLLWIKKTGLYTLSPPNVPTVLC